MTKKVTRLEDFISSRESADILSKKLGRPISPDYIRKLKNVRTHRASDKCIMYNKHDIEAATIKQKKSSS